MPIDDVLVKEGEMASRVIPRAIPTVGEDELSYLMGLPILTPSPVSYPQAVFLMPGFEVFKTTNGLLETMLDLKGFIAGLMISSDEELLTSPSTGGFDVI